MSDEKWNRLSSRYLYESSWYNLRQDEVSLPSGEHITYTLVEHPGYAAIVPLLDDGRIILEKVYRYTVQKIVLECPSGGLDGEPPEIAAKRELLEETGFRAEKLVSLGNYWGSNGISNEQFHLFLATDLTDTGQTQLEQTEQIELQFMPFDDALQMAISGMIRDAPSAFGIIRAAHYLNKLTID